MFKRTLLKIEKIDLKIGPIKFLVIKETTLDLVIEIILVVVVTVAPPVVEIDLRMIIEIDPMIEIFLRAEIDLVIVMVLVVEEIRIDLVTKIIQNLKVPVTREIEDQKVVTVLYSHVNCIPKCKREKIVVLIISPKKLNFVGNVPMAVPIMNFNALFTPNTTGINVLFVGSLTILRLTVRK